MSLRWRSVGQLRILDFDCEARPLSWISQDYVSKEVTAIAAKFVDEPDDVRVWLLGEVEPAEMLEGFRELYDQADMVTGHFVRCMVPETPVLTADLRWVRVGDLVSGNRLLAFDANHCPERRQWRFSTVISNRFRREPVMAVELESGEVFFATPDHPWLIGMNPDGSAQKRRWRRTDELLGAPPVRPGMFGKGPAWVGKYCEPWADDWSYEAGWLAGFFDGEGTIGGPGASKRKCQVVASQNPGPTYDLAVRLLTMKGFVVGGGPRSDVDSAWSIRIKGGRNEIMRFLGQVRPQRLLANWADSELGSLRQSKMVRVVRVEPAGEREIAALCTSTGTYIAAGYGAHNSYDLPTLSGAMFEHGLPPLGSKLTHDTKLDLVKRSGLSSSQESLGAMLGLEHPKVGMDQAKWREANRLTPAGLRFTRERVAGDVLQHIELRRRLLELGWLAAPRVWSSGSTRDHGYEP